MALVAEKIQVLIMEDSPADAEAMVLRLKQDGFDPDWVRVETPGELISRLTPSVDVILSDYHLPGYTATDLLRQLRDINNEIPVIVVSGMLGDEAAVDLLQDGAWDYVLKDRMARLAPAVERAIRERSLKNLRREDEERLRENESLLRSVLQAIEDVVWSMSLPSRKLVFVNSSAVKMFGRPPKEFLENPGVWRDVVLPEDQPVFDKAYQDAMKWGFGEAEYRILRLDGSTRRVRSRMWVAFKGGSAFRAEGIISDITVPAIPTSSAQARRAGDSEAPSTVPGTPRNLAPSGDRSKPE